MIASYAERHDPLTAQSSQTLFELDRILNRSLVYGGLTAGVIATHAATVALIGGFIPGNAPFAVVGTVADALRSPYVAIELDRGGRPRVEAAHGQIPFDATAERDLVRVPIVYQGSPVGRLVLSPRAANEPFSTADERLLADFARQAAPAVEAVRLTADLRRSREELVATREEERRRMRRDLQAPTRGTRTAYEAGQPG